MKVTRRNLLQLLALAGGATLLKARTASAAPFVPKRIVFYYTNASFRQGIYAGTQYQPSIIKSWWQPIAPDAPDYHALSDYWSTSDHALPDVHAPLAAYKSRMLYLDGLDMRSADVDPTGAPNGHLGGATHALTATNRAPGGSLGGGISIDQYIAQGLNSPSPVTLLPSLELGISPDNYPYENEAQQSTGAPVFAGPGQPITFSTNPLNAYNRMLPNGPNNDDAIAQAALAAKIKHQKSVLDFTAKRFDAQSARLGALDKARLDAHAAAIRGLQSRLSVPMNNQCFEPTAASIISQVQGAPGPFHAHTNVMFELAQVALACDLTRVMTIIGGDGLYDGDFGYVPGQQGSTGFHDLCHKTNGFNAPLKDDPGACDTVKAFHVAESALLGRFLAGLDAIPEADGTSLLDNTLVVWCTQIAGHDHTLAYLPYVLIGGLGGAVKSGRYVRYARVANTTDWPFYSNGRGHNDLFVTLAQLMGLTSTTTFGNPAVCQGALPGLT